MWTGHAELSELGVARFALYLTHDRKESTLKVYGFTVFSPVYGAGSAASADSACLP